MPQAQIQISNEGFKCYGENREFFYSTEHEQLLAGPYETGKTITSLFKLHVLLSLYPGAYALMVRKTYTSILNSAVVTFENKVLPVPPNHPDSLITKFGGNRPEWYGYPNGSRLIVAGLDNADKVLSAEYDYIYINQAEELTLGEYETLVGRATGPKPMILSDCNPAHPTHWLKNRPSIKMYNSRHEDNPMLFNQDTGEITAQGKRSIAALDALTGVRYKRGRLGLWAGVEGSVYEDFDQQIHVIKPFPIPPTWARYRVIDFGFRNPFVCQWWASDEDGRLYLYREIYMSGRTIADHAAQMLVIELL
jgi:phage terminase large subunit